MNHTRPALWISLVGLTVNIPFNYLLIYGGDGLVNLLGTGIPNSLQQLPALGLWLRYCYRYFDVDNGHRDGALYKTRKHLPQRFTLGAAYAATIGGHS